MNHQSLTDREHSWVLKQPSYAQLAAAHGEDDGRAIDAYVELAQKLIAKRKNKQGNMKLGSIRPLFEGFTQELTKLADAKASLLHDLARWGVMGGAAGAGTYAGQKVLSKANMAIDPELYGDSALKRTKNTAIGGVAAGALLHAIAKAGIKAR